jgi:hypothetical protein
MSVRHNYDKQNLDYNLLRVEALEKELDKTKKDLEIEKTRSRRFKKVGKGLYKEINRLGQDIYYQFEKLKIENEKLRYEQS